MNFAHDAIAGLVVGILVGLTGMGGASLMAPILIFFFHFKAKFAVGSSRLAKSTGVLRGEFAWVCLSRII